MKSILSSSIATILIFSWIIRVSFGIWKIELSQQHDKFQGDIVPEFSYYTAVIGRHQVYKHRQWPNGHIPYVIMPGYTQDEIQLIEHAMDRIMHSTCIRFFPRTDQVDYVHIENTEDGCFTTGIGRLGGAQKLSLQAGPGGSCMFYDIIVHELLHVVGLGHEHNRLDRDNYVKINFENVMMGAAHQFFKFSPQYGLDISNVPYDYSSIMHYKAYAFSKNRFSPTVEPKDSRFLDLIGNALDMSYYDLLKIAIIYNCPGLSDAGSFCRDRFHHCPKYINYCGTWGVMKFYCHKTCGLCIK